MPFDGTDFRIERERPGRQSSGEKVFCTLFIIVALCLMLMPISAAGLIDIVQYIRGG